MVKKHRDEELTLFLEMRRVEKENERNNILVPLNSEDLDVSNLESNGGSSPISKIVASIPKMGVDEILVPEKEKSDYDWLLSPPDTPLFPSLEMESQKTATVQKQVPNARSTALIPKVANAQTPALKGQVVLKHPSLTSASNLSTVGSRRPSSSGGSTTATSRSTTPSGKPLVPSTTKSSRASTPTSRAALPSSKPTSTQVRSSTPTRSAARSSTPSGRPSLSAAKTVQRSATPTQRSTPTSSLPSASNLPFRSASASKGHPANSKVQSHGISPTKKSNSRPSKVLDVPDLSLDAPPNLKTSAADRPASASRIRPSMPERPASTSRVRPSPPQRPASASRTRPTIPIPRTTSNEAAAKEKVKKQSCFPSGHIPTGSLNFNRGSIPAIIRSRFKDEEDVNPVLMGTMMVERVVSMRKLAPPKNDDRQSTHHNSAGKSSLSDCSGFGRTLSKKSLDMAMRHMDIRRSVNGDLKPIKTSVPASSTYSVRSVSTKSWTASASDSPFATSSNASSEPSVNTNALCLDGSEIEDIVSSGRSSHSPSNEQSMQLMDAPIQL